MEKQTIQITLSADLDYSSMIRHVANEVFENAKFSKAWCGRLKLVVDELYMNAVRYGSTKSKSLVHIGFEFDSEGIKFTIDDDGTGPQGKSCEQLKSIIQRNEANNDLTRTSGRGLAMIAKMWTDGMEINPSPFGGISVSFIKKIENASAPPATPAMDLAALSPEPLQVTMAPVPTPTPPSVSTSQPVSAPRPQGPVYRVSLTGEIDQSNMSEKIAPVVQDIDSMPEGSTLELDLSGVTYINSTFIGHLAHWYRILQQKRGALRLLHVNESVKEILTLVGLINVLDIVV